MAGDRSRHSNLLRESDDITYALKKIIIDGNWNGVFWENNGNFEKIVGISKNNGISKNDGNFEKIMEILKK